MSRIGNVNFVNKSLNQNNLTAKKKFGQNFLTDQNILKQIVAASRVTKEDAVIEIGGGLGALTEVLAINAGKVLTYEIDKDLVPILKNNLQAFGNVIILNEDILKVDIAKDIEQYLNDFKNIYVVANLPYYITTPIILKLLEADTRISRYVVMMQLEVADRICGKPKTKDYNALSVVVAYRAKATKVLKVPRTVFIPAPNVDSAVVCLDVYQEMPIKALNDEDFYKLLRISFMQRRKTFYNNLILGYDKEFVKKMLEDLRIKPSIRAEALELKDFVLLSDYITQNLAI